MGCCSSDEKAKEEKKRRQYRLQKRMEGAYTDKQLHQYLDNIFDKYDLNRSGLLGHD